MMRSAFLALAFAALGCASSADGGSTVRGECTDIKDGTPCGAPVKDPCATPQFCRQGQCVIGAAIECEDNNPCTIETCVGLKCTHPPAPNSQACDDGDPCQSGDTCNGGLCQAGPDRKDCNDKNPCTVDACEPFFGCRPSGEIVAPCDDGDPCTVRTICNDGRCVAFGYDTCDDGNACTLDLCKAGFGCTHTPTFALCDDGNPCTELDLCDGALCRGHANRCACTSDAVCHVTLPKDACAGTPTCVAGQCVYAPGTGTTCPKPTNPCLVSRCDASGQCVTSPALDGTGCPDTSVCSVGGVCLGGQCVGTPVFCNDQNDCTTDTCQDDKGCVFTPRTEGPCDDTDPCTEGEHCAGGYCGAGTYTCGPCLTKYDCIASMPASPCTKGFICDDGVCSPAESAGCDSSFDTACAHATCDVTTGACVMVTAADGTKCDDANLCSTDDACKAGVCGGKLRLCPDDGNVCTLSLCDPNTGVCLHRPVGPPCPDGSQCVFDGETFVCGNGKPCPVSGLPCDDGNACTGKDKCADGLCESGENTCLEVCDNGLDDDKDGFVDCADASCDYEEEKCPTNCHIGPTIVCDQGGIQLSTAKDVGQASPGNRSTEWPCLPTIKHTGPEVALTIDIRCPGPAVVSVTPVGPWTADAGATPAFSAILLKGAPSACLPALCVEATTLVVGKGTATLGVMVADTRDWTLVVDGIDGSKGDFTVAATCGCPEF